MKALVITIALLGSFAASACENVVCEANCEYSTKTASSWHQLLVIESTSYEKAFNTLVKKCDALDLEKEGTLLKAKGGWVSSFEDICKRM